MFSFIPAEKYCEKVFDGTHETPKPTNTGYKLITSKHILSGKIDSDNAYYISEEDYNSINKRSQVRQWDILFSMIGSVGNVYLVKKKDINFAIKNMGVFSCNDKNKALLLYFYLKSPYAKKFIENYLNGAVQKFLSLDMLRNFPIPLFNENDKKLYNLLYNIEEKIELNNNISTSLDTLAKSIYNYWFLQFEFTNEEGKPYRSSGGKMVWSEELKREIPEKFVVENIRTKCDIIDCLHSKKPEYHYDKDEYYLLELENLTESGYIDIGTKYYISEDDYRKWTKNIEISENDFVITNAGRTGAIGKIPKGITCALGRNFTAIRPRDINPIYLREYFKSNYFLEQMLGNLDLGSFFKSFNVKSIKQLNILIPEKYVLSQFTEIVAPMISKIENNILENIELSALRDFLLPLLMNGQVTFKDEKECPA